MKQEKQKILIVDDTPTNIQMLNSLLCDSYQILFSTSGADALEVVEREHPDLILLDIMMPDMDGFTVCKKLKANEDTRDIPVIFVTAMEDTKDETRGLELGAVDYITKPITPAIVKARVNNHLELKRHRDFLKHLSTLDGLTGVANRRLFDDHLKQEWHQCQHLGKPISLVLIDIDYFKQYNDYYGHLAGDDCLKTVADCLQRPLTKDNQLLARYGGEEFACIMPETDLEEATKITEQFFDAIKHCGIPHKASDISDKITISAGIATTIPGDGVFISSIIARADDCLYLAKESGRNTFKSVKY